MLYFVYSIQSKISPENYYIGLTTDIERRLAEHNTGESIHTNKFKPWQLVCYIAFTDKSKAENFELFLKSGAGRNFAKKRL